MQSAVESGFTKPKHTVSHLPYSGRPQDSIAHEVLSRAKQLHWTWTACNELAVAAVNGWPHLLPRLQREWCSLFLRAAEAARTMQRRCLPAG